MPDYNDVYKDLIVDNAVAVYDPIAEIIFDANNSKDDTNDSLPDITLVKEQPDTKQDTQAAVGEYHI